MFSQKEDEGGALSPHEDVPHIHLANEMIATPFLLTDEVFSWLSSGEAQRAGKLMHILGTRDTAKHCWPQLSAIAGTPLGAAPVTSYLNGQSEADPYFVRNVAIALFESGQIDSDILLWSLRGAKADAETVALVVRVVSNGLVHPQIATNALLVGNWADSVSPDDCAVFLRAIAGPRMENGAIVMDYLSMWIHKQRPLDGALAHLAWQCLETSELRHDGDAYNFDKAAAVLAPSDPERGFMLFEILCKQNMDIQAGRRWLWEPLESRSGGQFWTTLRVIDQVRLVRMVLDLVRADHYSPISLHVERAENKIRQEEDAKILMAYALESESQAKTVCEVMSLRASGFWPLAFHLLEHYPKNRDIERVLESRITQMDRYFENWDEEPEKSADTEVTRILGGDAIPDHSRRWLRGVAARIKRSAIKERRPLPDRSDYFRREDEIGDTLASWAKGVLHHRVGLERQEQLLPNDKNDDHVA
jgi:hypothetical protein